MSEPAMPRLKISREGVILIKSFEGFRPQAVRREDGRWVIGYGHTLSARPGGVVSEAEAELLLQYDLIPVAKALNGLQRPLNQHQFDALASFAFSVGLDRFQASDVAKRLTSGEADQAADAMVRWSEPLPAVAPLHRRAAERALFNADPSQPVNLAELLAAPLPDAAEMAKRPFAESAGAQAATAFAGGERDAANQRYLAYRAPIVGPLPGLASAAPETEATEDSEEAVAPFPAAGAPAFTPAISAEASAVDGGRLTLVSPDAAADVISPDEADPGPTASGDAAAVEGDDTPRADLRQTIRHEVITAKPGRQDWRDIGLYVAMSAFGLLTFGLAVAAFRRASQPMSGPEFMTISWVLAVFGFGCIAISAWNLYRKLGRSEA